MLMGSKRVGKRKTLQTKITTNELYDATLYYNRLFGYLVFVSGFPSLVSLPVYPQWSRSYSTCMLSCLLVISPVLPICCLFLRIPPKFFANCIFELIQAFSQFHMVV